jgi:hypothetical protein
MEANENKLLAAIVTIAETDKGDATDEDLERQRTLLGDIEAVIGIEAIKTEAIRTEAIGTERGDVIGTELATETEDLDEVRKKGRAVGVHGTIDPATTTLSAIAAH